jgi:hypothetical protein
MSSGAMNVSSECPACKARTEHPAWVVVDAEDRPDVIDELRQGRLRSFDCPRCGRSTATNTSLLLDTRRRSPLLFAPDPKADEQRSREQLFASLQIHQRGSRKSGSRALPAVLPIPHDLIVIAVDRDIDDDLASCAAGTWRGESVALQRYGRWLAQVVRERRDADLKQAISSLVSEATDAAGFARVVRAHPVLLTDAADELLAAMQDVAEQDAPPDYERRVAEWRHLLRLCRRDGTEATLGKLRDA